MKLLEDLLSWMEEADVTILLAVNGFHTGLLDSMMWGASETLTWVPLYLLMTAIIFRKHKLKGGIICMLVIGCMITMTDQTCASIIRPAFARLRPSSPDNPVSSLLHFVNGYRGGNFGFPSCHASNTFALALFLSLLFRKHAYTTLLMAWFVIVAYSRLYLGVHYPSDIIGGVAVGTSYALLSYHLVRVLPVPDKKAFDQARR